MRRVGGGLLTGAGVLGPLFAQMMGLTLPWVAGMPLLVACALAALCGGFLALTPSRNAAQDEPDSSPLTPLGPHGLVKHARTEAFTLTQWACLIVGYEPCKPPDPLQGRARGVREAFAEFKRLKAAALGGKIKMLNSAKADRHGHVSRVELQTYYASHGERPVAVFS